MTLVRTAVIFGDLQYSVCCPVRLLLSSYGSEGMKRLTRKNERKKKSMKHLESHLCMECNILKVWSKNESFIDINVTTDFLQKLAIHTPLVNALSNDVNDCIRSRFTLEEAFFLSAHLMIYCLMILFTDECRDAHQYYGKFTDWLEACTFLIQ